MMKSSHEHSVVKHLFQLRLDFFFMDDFVNNAGIGGIHVDVISFDSKASQSGLPNFWEHATQDYESAVEGILINYYGVKRMIEAFVPLLQKSNSPRIVNVSSTWGQLKFVPNGRIKEILADDVDDLTEEKIDEAIDEFLKDVKEGSLKAKGWTAFTPAYTISKAAMNG